MQNRKSTKIVESILKNQRRIISVGFLLIAIPWFVFAQSKKKPSGEEDVQLERASVESKAKHAEDGLPLSGYASEQFLVGPVMYKDMLNDQQCFSNDWIVQQSPADSILLRYARIEKGKLHVHDPRGCTIWYKTKLSGPLMISYRVTCPSEYTSTMDIVPRDINQFWMARTPKNVDPNAAGGLFDKEMYDGEFDSYHDLLGYYASTGGGNVSKNNRTTRLRRYPRKIGNVLVDHVALCFRDDQKEFLIVPDKEHLVQLVAAGDIIQYIFDGKIVYELKKGDSVDILNDDNKTMKKGVWGNAPWTTFQEGYFGFRMTRTHHVYSEFKVYRLIAK